MGGGLFFTPINYAGKVKIVFFKWVFKPSTLLLIEKFLWNFNFYGWSKEKILPRLSVIQEDDVGSFHGSGRMPRNIKYKIIVSCTGDSMEAVTDLISCALRCNSLYLCLSELRVLNKAILSKGNYFYLFWVKCCIEVDQSCFEMIFHKWSLKTKSQ